MLLLEGGRLSGKVKKEVFILTPLTGIFLEYPRPTTMTPGWIQNLIFHTELSQGHLEIYSFGTLLQCDPTGHDSDSSLPPGMFLPPLM